MDIELKLREMLVLRDPGGRFTDGVLARVGDAPQVETRDGVVRISDAGTRKRGRRLLIGVLVLVGAAAAMVPLLSDRKEEAVVVSQTPVAEAAADALLEVDPGAGLPDEASALASGEAALDCIDPDVLRGLLLPAPYAATFRIVAGVPAELADFKPPRQLNLLGITERAPSGIKQVSAIYRTTLAPGAALAAAAQALESAGWTRHADDRMFASSVFIASNIRSADFYCRDGKQVGLSANALDGVTYVVLAASRVEGTGITTNCDRPQQTLSFDRAPFDEYMPRLELPPDPATGQPVPLMTGGGGLSNATKRRTGASFRVKDSPDGVARHFASQMSAQGWEAESNWSGAGTAGSTWTRRMADGAMLQGMLSISAFGDDHFTASFRAVIVN